MLRLARFVVVGPAHGPKSVSRDKVLRRGADLEAPRGRSPLYETKSSDEGQNFEALCGRSPLYETKTSDEGQIIEALTGRSPLYETKSSDEGQILRPLRSESAVCDKVLHVGCSWRGFGQ